MGALALGACGGENGDEAGAESTGSVTAAATAAGPTCAYPYQLTCDAKGAHCRCRTSPTLSPALPAIDIAAGTDTTYLIKPDKTVWAWGSSHVLGPYPSDMDGIGAWGDPYQPVPASMQITNAVQLSAGENGGCALQEDGGVTCWGRYDASFDGPLGPYAVMYKGAPLKTAVSVSHGNMHACAVLEDANVVCWGDNTHGQLGDGTKLARSDARLVTTTAKTTAQVAAAGDTTCILSTKGIVSCFGDNSRGALGNGASGSDLGKPAATPAPVKNLAATAIAIYGGGNGSFCATRVDKMPVGGATAFSYPDLVNGAASAVTSAQQALDTANQLVSDLVAEGFPETSGTLIKARADAKMYADNLAKAKANRDTVLANEPKTVCWGDSTNHQIDANSLDVLFPVDESAVTVVPVAPRAIGFSNGCAWSIDDGPVCWGSNTQGQIDAKRLASAGQVYKMAIGDGHICAMNRNSVLCWGMNQSAQLGLGTETDAESPSTPTGIDRIFCPGTFAVTCSASQSGQDHESCVCDYDPSTMQADVLAKWISLGRENGVLGYPITGWHKINVGRHLDYTVFEHGRIHHTVGVGTYYMTGAIEQEYQTVVNVHDAVQIAFLVSDPVVDGFGTYNPFARGVIYSKPGIGAHWVSRDWAPAYARAGGQLGYPTEDADDFLDAGYSYQKFEFGIVIASPSGMYWGGLGISNYFLAERFNGRPGIFIGPMGAPTMDETTVTGPMGGGQFMTTEHGYVAWSGPTGVFGVSAQDITAAAVASWLQSVGLPTSEMESAHSKSQPTAMMQTFQRAAVFVTSNGTFNVSLAYYDVYLANPWLGLPTSAKKGVNLDPRGGSQEFENGEIIGNGSPVAVRN
jgi:alpha-tubulin suppressor-like RCC1 family protein